MRDMIGGSISVIQVPTDHPEAGEYRLGSYVDKRNGDAISTADAQRVRTDDLETNIQQNHSPPRPLHDWNPFIAA